MSTETETPEVVVEPTPAPVEAPAEPVVEPTPVEPEAAPVEEIPLEEPHGMLAKLEAFFASIGKDISEDVAAIKAKL